jgi:ornithine cyclodeaminase/alanine dehydrogenase-like protein (mu-crystallin family)
MKVISPSEVRAAISPEEVLAAVRDALIAHAEARTIVPAPIHLAFLDADGDAYVKAGMILGSATFTVKSSPPCAKRPASALRPCFGRSTASHATWSSNARVERAL